MGGATSAMVVAADGGGACGAAAALHAGLCIRLTAVQPVSGGAEGSTEGAPNADADVAATPAGGRLLWWLLLLLGGTVPAAALACCTGDPKGGVEVLYNRHPEPPAKLLLRLCTMLLLLCD